MIPAAKKPEARPAKSDEPRNYSNPDPMNCGLEGKSLTVTLVNGRIESGKLMKAGQYFIEMVGSNGRSIIIAKSAIITVSVL
jgi:sRNA-binding regulator protein Hfq